MLQSAILHDQAVVEMWMEKLSWMSNANPGSLSYLFLNIKYLQNNNKEILTTFYVFHCEIILKLKIANNKSGVFK